MVRDAASRVIVSERAWLVVGGEAEWAFAGVVEEDLSFRIPGRHSWIRCRRVVSKSRNQTVVFDRLLERGVICLHCELVLCIIVSDREAGCWGDLLLLVGRNDLDFSTKSVLLRSRFGEELEVGVRSHVLSTFAHIVVHID